MPESRRALLVQAGAVGNAAGELLSAELDVTATGIDAVPDTVAGFDVVAMATDRPYPSVAELVDERCWLDRVPWCAATLVAHVYRVGPLVVPGRSPCHGCWSRRVASQAPDPELHALLELIGRRTVGAWFAGELSALDQQTAAILAAEVVALAAGTGEPDPLGMGWFWEGDAVYGGLRRHCFARIGPCRRCGAHKLPETGGIALAAEGWSGR